MAKMESGVKGIYRLEDKPNNKCRKWKIVLSLGRDAATGKYRQTSRNFTGTFTQAKAEKRILQGQAEEGKIVKRSSYTFKQYAEHWMEVRTTSGKIAPTTLRRDRNKLKAVYHLIGQARLQDITSQELEAAYARLQAGESISGKPLSGTYVRDIGKKISVMFDHAVKTGVLPANPCKSAEAPKQDTQERRAMPEDLFHGLVGRLDPHDSMQFAVLAITQLGLRRSEVTGISREDVDFEAHVISVRNDYPDTGDLKEAKTTAGRRSLPMSDFLESAIRQRILAMLFDFERFAPHLIVRDAKGRPADIVGGGASRMQRGGSSHPRRQPRLLVVQESRRPGRARLATSRNTSHLRNHRRASRGKPQSHADACRACVVRGDHGHLHPHRHRCQARGDGRHASGRLGHDEGHAVEWARVRGGLVAGKLMGAREAEAVKRSLAKLAYLVAVIEGCACIVEDMEERQHDPRLWPLAAALNSCKADLDALDELLSETFDA